MNTCYLLKPSPTSRSGGGNPGSRVDTNGGGNTVSARAITVRRWAAIGDSLAATVVADKLAERGYVCRWVAHPDIHCVLKRQPSVAEVTELAHADVDLDGCYEKDPQRRWRHFSDMFITSANKQLSRYGINLGPALNCRPRIRLSCNEKVMAQSKFSTYDRPWVFICPRSNSYAARQVPDGVWKAAAAKIPGTKFWMGTHPAPDGLIDLKLRHLDMLVTSLSAADLIISVDTGPLHIAAALGVPILAIGQSSSPSLHLGDQVDYLVIEPKLECLNCQQNICPINQTVPPCQNVDPDFIASWAVAKLGQHKGGLVSAIVAVWKPKAEVLNRCLEAVVDQVHEVIVTAEGKSILPANALKHPKIRYVRTTRANIGYSGNANFGAHNSVGQWLLMLNDDCFLAPGAVQKMRDCLSPDVGIVSNLLRYPDGTIYYAGKVRTPGVRAWGHIDHRREHPTFSNVTEIENACGCCILVRRSAFYDANGFDEELPLFGQDDVLSLAVRQQGYKILFTPHSTGIHLEHQSVQTVGNIYDLVGEANHRLGQKLGWYLDLNLNRVPGQFT